MNNNTELHAFAATHHGLITRSVASRIGMSTAAWYRAIQAGRLEQLHPGVARPPGAPVSFEQRALAAVWAAGTGAMGSHRTSASLWGAPRPSTDPIDVILPERSRQASLDGVVIHRPASRVDLRSFVRRRVPVTSPLRMLIDLGAVDPDGVYPALEALIIARLVSPQALVDTLVHHARSGRHGVAAFRDALDRYPLAMEVADSTLETKMAALALRYCLPPMTFHEIVLGYEVDFRVDGTNVILECDGREHHELGHQFELDRQRDAELLAEGWFVMRFTWRQLDRSPGKVAERIRAVLRRWAPDLVPKT